MQELKIKNLDSVKKFKGQVSLVVNYCNLPKHKEIGGTWIRDGFIEFIGKNLNINQLSNLTDIKYGSSYFEEVIYRINETIKIYDFVIINNSIGIKLDAIQQHCPICSLANNKCEQCFCHHWCEKIGKKLGDLKENHDKYGETEKLKIEINDFCREFITALNNLKSDIYDYLIKKDFGNHYYPLHSKSSLHSSLYSKEDKTALKEKIKEHTKLELIKSLEEKTEKYKKEFIDSAEEEIKPKLELIKSLEEKTEKYKKEFIDSAEEEIKSKFKLVKRKKRIKDLPDIIRDNVIFKYGNIFTYNNFQYIKIKSNNNPITGFGLLYFYIRGDLQNEIVNILEGEEGEIFWFRWETSKIIERSKKEYICNVCNKKIYKKEEDLSSIPNGKIDQIVCDECEKKYLFFQESINKLKDNIDEYEEIVLNKHFKINRRQ